MPYEFVSDDVFDNCTFDNVLQKRSKKHFPQGKQTVLIIIMIIIIILLLLIIMITIILIFLIIQSAAPRPHFS